MDGSTSSLIGEQIPRLRRAARFMCRDPALADELVQECLLQAVSRIDTWKPGTNLRAWLLTILRNAFLTERIRRAPVTGPHYSVPRDPEHAAADAAALEGVQEGQQDFAVYLATVQRTFDRLSDEHREVLVLIALEEFNYKEAASVLDLPVGTVRSRLSRARTAMRAVMPEISEAKIGVDQSFASVA